jgi:DNA adenine methylase
MPTDRQSPFRKLSPIVKWAGGKKSELKYILPRVPAPIINYYEPFVGGGAVYTAVEAELYYINDRSTELISLYRCLSGIERQRFFEAVDRIDHCWRLLTDITENNSSVLCRSYRRYATDILSEGDLETVILAFVIERLPDFDAVFSHIFEFDTPNFLGELKINMMRKLQRMKVLEQEKHIMPEDDVLSNIETSLKSALYMHFRHISNHSEKYKLSESVRTAIFLFIRNYAYSGMFRYNNSGLFNVPYGGIGYNRKSFARKIEYLKSKQLSDLLEKTTIAEGDFETFLRETAPGQNDFVFLDPPYDSEFSTYAKNEFAKADQARLADYLIDDCRTKWMLVIKNTPLIRDLYFEKHLHIMSFDKNYLVSFMNRNDKNAEHLLITNY